MENIEQNLKEIGFDVEGLREELKGKNKRKKRIYSIYIKSHTDMPDYEKEVEAENVVEAIKEFKRMGLSDWDSLAILEHIEFPMHDLPEEDKLILRLLDEIKELQTKLWGVEK